MPFGDNMCGSHASRADTTRAERLRPGGGGLPGTAAGFNGWEEPHNGVESEFSLYTSRDAAPHRIGTAYVMALFREYEDGGFTTLKHGMHGRSNEASAHLGMQGPVMRALPGDAIKIVLRNNLRFACNFVLVGVTPVGGVADERPLAPGETRTLTYFLHSSHGPAVSDTADSIALYYTSDSIAAAHGQAAYDAARGVAPSPPAPFADYAAGLFGAVIVTREKADRFADIAPKDVSREFVLFMGILDQNKSPYLDINIAQFASAPETVFKRDHDFKESNRMHSINGYVYCNLEGLEMVYGRKARYYVFSLGADDAMVSPNWAGHATVVNGERQATPLVQPGQGVVADIRHQNKGLWLLADQTAAHARAGAAALFRVKERVTIICSLSPWSTC